MTIERARVVAYPKPWGVDGVRPWSDVGGQIGELWFERANDEGDRSQLQLKLLFTSAPLSIQVHPGDEQAVAAGFERGKTEAWYVLSASTSAKVGVGLRSTCSQRDILIAVDSGAIEALLDWRAVSAGDLINVPAGTIHAIGAGLVIAEVQQRSDLTYRLYDYGRGRELHLNKALAVSSLGPSQSRARSGRISDQRQLLSATPFFCFERITLAPTSRWRLETPCETWLLTLRGSAAVAGNALETGQALYIEGDHGDVQAGHEGVTLLAAYALPSVLPYLLQRAAQGRPDGQSASITHSLLGRALKRTAIQTAERRVGL